MKKFLLIATALCLSGAFLTSCGDDDSPSISDHAYGYTQIDLKMCNNNGDAALYDVKFEITSFSGKTQTITLNGVTPYTYSDTTHAATATMKVHYTRKLKATLPTIDPKIEYAFYSYPYREIKIAAWDNSNLSYSSAGSYSMTESSADYIMGSGLTTNTLKALEVDSTYVYSVIDKVIKKPFGY